MGMGCVRLQRRIRYVHTRHHRWDAAAGERRQMRVRLPHSSEDARLRVYGVRKAVKHNQEEIVDLETLRVRQEGGVLFADIVAPPMILGTELVRDRVSLVPCACSVSPCTR